MAAIWQQTRLPQSEHLELQCGLLVSSKAGQVVESLGATCTVQGYDDLVGSDWLSRLVLVALAGLTARSPDTRRYYLNVISQLTQVLRVLRRRL